MPENNVPNSNSSLPNTPPQKPLNPEMEAVSANQPKVPVISPTPAPPVQSSTAPATLNKAVSAVPAGPKPGTAPLPPQKIGKEQNTRSKQKFLIGCFGGFIFLFVLFIVLMVLMVARSGASNPVMQAFGLDPSGIRSFLQGVVGFSFGLISLLFLVMTVVALFRFLGTQKSDKEKRTHQVRMMILSSVLLTIVIFLWVVLATYIARLTIVADRVTAEIVVVEPEDLSNLEAPVQVKFSAFNVARALAQNGVQIESMNWDLDGDGEFETPVRDPEVTHLFNRKGTYTVALQVKVAGEAEYRPAYTKVISIQNAVFIATPSSGTAPLVVQFDATDIVSRDSAGSIDWDFDGDGQFELEGPNNLNPRHTFDKIGTYNVHLRVVDKNNNVQNYRRNIDILPTDEALLSAQIEATPSLNGPQPLQINFNADESKSLKGSINSYEWNFGDGSEVQSGKNVSKIYEKPGFYTVTLVVQDTLGNKAQATVEVEVEEGSSIPEAIITSDPPLSADETVLSGILPFKVMFNASKSVDADNDIVEYEWDFDGDGQVDKTGEKVEYIFEKEGQFTLSLNVQDTEKQSDSTTLSVNVQNPGVQAKMTATPEEGTAPLIVQFDGSSSTAYQANIVSYEWDFGDGSAKTITGAVVSHKYSAVGTYEARLKVLTNNNLSATTTMTIFVREIPLKACFTPSRISGLAPLTVTFDSKCSTGTVSKHAWQFGDGEESSSASPTYTFEEPGSYNVTLEITDNKNNVNSYQTVIVAEGELK